MCFEFNNLKHFQNNSMCKLYYLLRNEMKDSNMVKS